MENNPLRDKHILITGSSRGIGASIARIAKGYGAEVILHGKTESEELKIVASELNAKYIFCDTGNETEVKMAMKTISKVDILINNAGISLSKSLKESKTEEWLATYNTNIMGIVNFSKEVIPKMELGIGKIINIASIKGLASSTGRPAFASSKAGVIALTASMAKELGPNILVNCVAPGFTETETTKKDWSERIYKQIDQTILKRAAKPEEIAEVVLFLASNKSNYITGQTIIVDGGYSISL